MFSNKLIVILLINLTNFIINCLEFNNNDSNDCFRAAVYEHIIVGNVTTDEPMNIINSNLDVFDEIAVKASEMGAHILVFPEDGIIDPVYTSGYTRDNVSQFAEEVDDPHNGNRHNPCEEPQKYNTRPILYRLSCMAKRNAIYIVADMGDFVKCNTTDPKCPKDGHYLFNTAVAFDTEGYLVAKYHKMQLFYENVYNTPPKSELIYFDTPFGRIGLHICADIIYKLPGTQLVADYNVTTMAFPTFWFWYELPFLSATQIQQSWAITNRVNLLAANIHWPQKGSIGSGIYSGERGAIVYTNIPDNSSKLLIADIPIDSRNTKAKCFSNPFSKTIQINTTRVVSNEFTNYSHANLRMDAFTRIELNKQNDYISSCSDGFCCRLNYSVESKQTLEEESYWFVITNRTLNTTHYPICEEICGLVRCDSDCKAFPLKTDKTIFKSIEITANFSTKYSYPSLTTNDLQLVSKNKWNYYNNGSVGSQVRLDINGFYQPIISAGLYGRCFSRDPPYRE